LILRKKKYYFNQTSLTFEEINPGKRQRRVALFSYIVVIVIVTLLSGYLLSSIFGSPEARILENELSLLKKDMHDLLSRGKSISSLLHNEVFPKDNAYRTILQIDTLPVSLRDAGTGGSAANQRLINNNDITYQLDNLVNKLDRQLKIQSGSYETVYRKALMHARNLAHMPAILPVAQTDLVMISTDFGVRSDPFNHVEQLHNGLDFIAPTGKNVYATGDGTVTFIQLSRTGYGKEIVIDHSFGFGSRYAHLDTILVTGGQKVKRGQLIGKVGASGRATGPHLHYEVLYEKRPVNPGYYFDNGLSTDEYRQILEQASGETR
jgi:murein DD-endopeptidase MepM/ murein hydrolase activator NlpD